MGEPTIRTSRLVIAGGLLAAMVVAVAGFGLGRMTVQSAPALGETPAAGPAPAPEVPVPPLIEVPRALDRAGLIDLAKRAADAFSSGEPMPPAVVNAAGQRFDVALPFGCDGPAPATSSAPLRWRYEAGKQTLRVHVAPTRWAPEDWGLVSADEGGALLDGFWISRPWSSAGQCPPARGEAGIVGAGAANAQAPEASDTTKAAQPSKAADGSKAAATPANPAGSAGAPSSAGETLALAELLPQAGRRVDRPFETVQRMSPDRLAPARGLRLRVTGHIARLPGKAPVRCAQPGGIAQRPVCLIVVTFDDIRLENPAGGETLAIWSMNRTPRTAP